MPTAASKDCDANKDCSDASKDCVPVMLAKTQKIMLLAAKTAVMPAKTAKTDYCKLAQTGRAAKLSDAAGKDLMFNKDRKEQIHACLCQIT